MLESWAAESHREGLPGLRWVQHAKEFDEMRGLALAKRLANARVPPRGNASAAGFSTIAHRTGAPRPPTNPTAAASAAVPEQPLVFDTYRLVRLLEGSGLSERTSAAVTGALVEVSQAAQRQAAAQVVTKSEFVALRSELSILEKADFAVLKSDIVAVEKRLETAVAEIYTAVEKSENKVIKYVVGVAGMVSLFFLRATTSAPQHPAPPVAVAEHQRPRDSSDGPRIKLIHV